MTRLLFSRRLIAFLVCLVGSSNAQAQVPEIPRRGLGGIARVQMTRYGPAIYYNPRAVRRIGPEAWSFFRAHEYAHIQLGHFYRNISRQQAEAEADSYAARVASPNAVAAARRMFASGWGGSRDHGSAATRAARLSGPSTSYASVARRVSASPYRLSPTTRNSTYAAAGQSRLSSSGLLRSYRRASGSTQKSQNPTGFRSLLADSAKFSISSTGRYVLLPTAKRTNESASIFPTR